MSETERCEEIQRMTNLIEENDVYSLNEYASELAQDLFHADLFDFYMSLDPDGMYWFCKLWDDEYSLEDIEAIFALPFGPPTDHDHFFSALNWRVFETTWAGHFRRYEKPMGSERLRKSAFRFLKFHEDSNNRLYYSMFVIFALKDIVGEDRVIEIMDRGEEFKEMREGDIIRLAKAEQELVGVPLSWAITLCDES